MTDQEHFDGAPADAGEDHAEWVTVGNYRTGLEAEMARQVLEAEGIPVLSRSDAPGIFGLSFQGSVTGGITLQVPSPELERSRQLLESAP